MSLLHLEESQIPQDMVLLEEFEALSDIDVNGLYSQDTYKKLLRECINNVMHIYFVHKQILLSQAHKYKLSIPNWKFQLGHRSSRSSQL